MKNRLKNKTFEVENNKNNFINKITSNKKESFKIYHKNKINHQNNKTNSNDLNNQVVIKKNNARIIGI